VPEEYLFSDSMILIVASIVYFFMASWCGGCVTPRNLAGELG
jgi:hypothetical protein